ncbi:MAG TPA: adenosyl-hopene transferase HpnH [Gemmatimonadaceae bacterium]|jgi:hopanoid biosynthesis associated radical SAM protein HpnH|nr:adenosyl-hopene transferase HpnH [Gemmatimonadaceae bacterium]
MGIPFMQQARIASYVVGKKLSGQKKYPLVLMLEPLFQCNLECAGCGKIAYSNDVLKQRLTVEECLAAVDECGAPVVAIPGGEPLIHKDIPQIVAGIVARKKLVSLCTNAILLAKRIDEFTPSPYLMFSVHLDGLQERHDASVCREGIFEKAVTAIRIARNKGFRVGINCTLFQGENPEEVAKFFDFVTEMGVEGITVSPGYSYEMAPRHDVFLGRTESKKLFRDIFKRGEGKKWPFTDSALFLDFLAGNQEYECTPWSTVTRNVFGWQKPCYLLVNEGYAPTYQALMDETDWDAYGTGKNPKCDNCMAHCGYEGTAVNDAMAHPLKAMMVSLRGPRTDGPLAKDPEIRYTRPTTGIPLKVISEPMRKSS